METTNTAQRFSLLLPKNSNCYMIQGGKVEMHYTGTSIQLAFYDCATRSLATEKVSSLFEVVSALDPNEPQC